MASSASRVTANGGFTLVGRSSSSFTRIARIFALELGVPHAFRVVPSLMSLDPADYGDNPALKLPALETPQGTWFGSTNICRVLSRHASVQRRVVWPEALDQPLAANAQELTLVALSTEVALIMSTMGGPTIGGPMIGDLAIGGGGGAPHVVKMQKSLRDTLTWLDAQVEHALAALPRERDLSFLEVALFCLVTHLEFRSVLRIDPFAALAAFSRRFEERPSAQQTAYRFDI
jgi:glutathione S-transferase